MLIYAINIKDLTKINKITAGAPPSKEIITVNLFIGIHNPDRNPVKSIIARKNNPMVALKKIVLSGFLLNIE